MASEVREQLVRVGFNAPQWWDLRAGLRPPGQRVDERHVGISGHGWQHEATEAVHAHLFSTTLWRPLSARTSFDPVTRRPDVRGPLHVLPCEPGSPGSTLLRSVCCCCVASGFPCLLPPVRTSPCSLRAGWGVESLRVRS